MKILFNFLGIVLYFVLRYGNRADKNVKFSGTFWLNDNWPETVGTIIFDIVFMLLLAVGGVTIDLGKWIPSLPEGVAFVGDFAICFVIGAVIAHGAYELFKAKVKK